MSCSLIINWIHNGVLLDPKTLEERFPDEVDGWIGHLSATYKAQFQYWANLQHNLEFLHLWIGGRHDITAPSDALIFNGHFRNVVLTQTGNDVANGRQILAESVTTVVEAHEAIKDL